MPDINDITPSFTPRENYKDHLLLLQEFFHEEVLPEGLAVELQPESSNEKLGGPTDMYLATVLTVVRKREGVTVDTIYRQKLSLSSLTGNRTSELIPEVKANIRTAITHWKLYLEIETTLMK
jgi:hypothetical protein